MKNPKTVRSAEIVSRMHDDNGQPLFTEEIIAAVLEEKANIIKDYAYIVHNFDTYTAEDAKKNENVTEGAIKPTHIHLLLRFQNNQPQQFDYIGKWFGLASQFVQKIKGRWVDALLYLTHSNAPEKYQYNEDDVVANFDVSKAIEEGDSSKYLDMILQKIYDGEIREYNKTFEIDPLILIKKSRLINDAFKVRQDYLMASQKDRDMDVIFITGAAGSGKTTLAKMIAQKRGLAYFVSSGSNDIMDGYAQEPCIIIDDVRPSSMGLSDLLKLLDNNTVSTVKSRYRNKFINADLIILTTVLTLDEFYRNVFDAEHEPITQLKRRCKTHITMNGFTIQIQRWDDAIRNYSQPEYYNNTILEQYVQQPKSKEEHRAEINSDFSFLTPSGINNPEIIDACESLEFEDTEKK